MKKVFLTLMAATVVSVSTNAGGLLTNTNQNAIFLRNPARDAAIGIDGVYSNPAGIAFLPQGLHLSLSWQAAWQKRQITSTAPFYGFNANNPSNTHFFEGTATAPVIPSVQAAYVINDKWSVSAQFAVGGGGGKCEFANGLPMFEQLMGGQLASGIAAAVSPGTQGYKYTMNQSLTGEQYFYGIQLGATYKITDKVAVFGGVRGVIAQSGYEGAITGFSVNGISRELLHGAMSQGYQQAYEGAQFAAGEAQRYAELAATTADPALQAQYAAAAQTYGAAAQQYAAAAKQAGTAALMTSSDLVLDCQQKGFGIQPIIGLDVNLGKLNLAAKYEFRARIEMENESKNSPNVDAAFAAYQNGAKVRSDIPALLTLGAQYSFTKNVRAMGGFHYYFDKDAKGSATQVDKNTWEVTLGAEWDVNEWLTVSAGAQRTQYGFGDDMQDTNFNINSTALCLGASFKVNEHVNINAGYMHSFYEDDELNRGNGITDIYTRKNDVVGVSVDLHF